MEGNAVIDYSRAVEILLSHSKMVAEDAQASYLHRSIEKIYKWWIQCDQSSIPKEGYIEGLRVIRLNRGLPKYVFSVFKSLNSEDAEPYARTFLSGIYMVIPCVVFSKSFVEESMAHGRTKKLTTLALPEELRDRYKESTLRKNIDGTMICLEKSDLTDWIYYGSHYKMLELTDV